MTAAEERIASARAVERVARNAAILAATSVFCRIGSLAVVPLILRAFTPADYGAYSAAFAYAGLLGMVAYFGMNQVVVRDISRGERARGAVIFHCVAIRGMLLAPAAAVLTLIGLVKGFTPLVWVLSWLAFAVMSVDALTGAIRASLQAAGRFGAVAGVDAVRKSSQWAIAIAVVAAGASITTLAGGVVAAAAMALGAAWIMGIERRDLNGLSFAPDYAGRMLRLAAPMGVSAAFVAALDNVDIWLLDWLKTSSDVALYKAASVFKPAFVAQAVVWALMPLAFRIGRTSPSRLAGTAATAARFLVVAGSAAAIFFFCGADILVPLLAGSKYSGSIPVFQAMGVTLPFVFLSFLYLHMLTAVDRQYLAVFVFAGALAANAAADLLLIPRLGALGAMLGTLSAEALMAAASLAIVWKVIGRPFDSRTLRAAVAAAAALLAAILTRGLSIADMGTVALAVLAVMLVALGGVARRDFALVKKAFVRRV